MRAAGPTQPNAAALLWVAAVIAAVTLWRLMVANGLPLTRDEAYYYDWASQLAWGYFDHPPGVALLGLGARLDPGALLSARLGALLIGTASLIALWRLYRASGLSHGRGLLLALILAATSFPSLIAGVVTTPDSILALCWPLALHEALRALQGQRRRWLSAGLITGLGLLGKYTMVLIGPVFLWAVLRADPKALRTPWPYLGGLVALLVFLPNILWNAGNDWLTMRFQFGHGFSTDTGSIDLAAQSLPAVSGAHAYIADPSAAMDLGERVSSFVGFAAEQLGFWGLVLIPVAIALWRLGGISGMARRASSALAPAAQPLLGAAALVPLLVFGTVALGSEVEANWAALYLVGAAAFIAPALVPLGRWTLLAVGANLTLASLYVANTATGLPPLPDAAERALRESRGFEPLAAYAADLRAPVIADRYQFAAMLNFYQPQLEVTQWPGITRPSEYERGRITPLPDPRRLRETGFWLLAHKFSPPTIAGFEAVETRSAYGCPDGRFSVVDGAAGWEAGGCDDPANIWRLYRYLPTGPAR